MQGVSQVWSSFRPSPEEQSRLGAQASAYASAYTRVLVLLFVLTLPLANPWVRGDGVGYYAYVHALLIHHDLNFEQEWRAGNSSFTMGVLDRSGNIRADQYTATGHIDNHFSVGPSMLWAPFLVSVHLAVSALHRLGLPVKPDGFSRPYVLTMALATALYGFLGLFLCFKLSCSYVEEQWAFLATVGIWFASSLPVYMYFNPSWSHAHSVFSVSLVLWYWHRTRRDRTLVQWLLLGIFSGLMLDVYYPNIMFLLVPLLESLQGYWRSWRRPGRNWPAFGKLFFSNVLYSLAVVAAFLPTLITRKIIYGSFISIATYGKYGAQLWQWTSPALVKVLLSSDHGLLTWTPIVIPALAGLVLFRRYDREFAAYLIVAALAYYYLISADVDWDGLSSFGARYFIPMTPLFVLGLAAALSELARWLKSNRAALRTAIPVMGLLVVWNWGFIFQWGTQLVPARGPISWKRMVSNQVSVVPQELIGKLGNYFGDRGALMQKIERQDVDQLKERARRVQ